MAVSAKNPATVCLKCGEAFVQPNRRGRPRTMCEVCRPPRTKANKPRPSFVRSQLADTAPTEAPKSTGPAKPFTVSHFDKWARDLILDNDESWVPDDFFLAFSEDLFAGIPECWLIVPEANGKTTSMSGLALYHCEFRPYAWAPWAAASRDQAEIGYMQAEGIVLRSPRLRSLFKPLPGYRRIRNEVNGSKIQVFAADERTGDGVIPTLGFLDELHRHRNMRLYRTWVGKLTKRGGQIAVLSTAGEPGTEFEETRERIRQTGDKVIDGCFTRAKGRGVVLHDWAIPEDGDVSDLALVEAANPSPRVTIDTLREKFESPTNTLAHWTRFTCNRPTRDVRSAITEAEWHEAITDRRIPDGSPIWAGLDVAWKWDTTALVPLWMPEPEFRLFGEASILEPPRDGSSLDPAKVEDSLSALAHRYDLHTVVMDTSRAEQLAEWIRAELDVNVVDRVQTNSLAVQDYERFMEALRMGYLHHSGDVGLTSHALNAIARILPGGDARFDRPSASRTDAEAQGRRVIDGLTAAAMVHSQMVADMNAAPVYSPRAIDLSSL